MGSHRPQLRVFGLALLGTLLLQAAWVLVVPPFSGLDEHRHAYKAAAVAHGDWSPHHEIAPTGDEGLVVVPRDLVQAALPVCKSLHYTVDDCDPLPSDRAGMVRVPSGTAAYNPVFYFVVGTAARPATGVHALYLMRAATALMCALLVAYGIAVATSWVRSPVFGVATLLAATPMVIYSTAVVAPNGVEMAAALLVWLALLGLRELPVGDPRVARLLVAATVGAVPLATLRTLGPLWLALIIATCAVLTPREQLASVVGSRQGRLLTLLATVASAGGIGWSLAARANTIPGDTPRWPGLWSDLPRQYVLWFMQSAGVFPSRLDRAPLSLYALVFAGCAALLVAGVKAASPRERIAVLTVFAVSSAVPIAVTIVAFAHAGPVWQGRYGYPYAVGVFLICACSLDRRSASGAGHPAWPWLGFGMLAVPEGIGLLHVLALEIARNPLYGTPDWGAPSRTTVLALVGTGAALLTLAATGRSVANPVRPPDTVTAARRSDRVAAQVD